MKAIVISGHLNGLSNNILPFLDSTTDVFVHTWNVPSNGRWEVKLNRYRSRCRRLTLLKEDTKFQKKLHSYFYSTWKAVNLIEDIDQYKVIVKFKPNLDTAVIPYKGFTDYYFHKASIQARPLLNKIDKESCMYGSIYYQTMDERMFTGYPLAFKKAFHILYKDFHKQMVMLDENLTIKYGEDYEGSIFWKEWLESKNIKLIQDLDLKLPNNIQQ